MEDFESNFDKFSVEMGDFEVRKTGKFSRMWIVEPGGSMLQFPAIADDTIYFGSFNFNMYAVDRQTGRLKWKFKCENMIGESSPQYHEGRLYFGSMDYNVYCLDAENGRLIWKFRTQGEVYSAGVIGNGKLYIGSRDRNMYCIDAETGKLIWKFETQGELATVPSVHDGRLFFGSFDHNFYCLDTETGKLLWKFGTHGEVHTMNGPEVADGKVYFASFDNFIRAVDIETGKLVWKFPTGQYGNSTSPVIHGERIYHSSRDGILYCLTLDGKLIWKFVNPYHVSVPFIYEDRIYVGSEDKNVYCISPEGKKLWQFKTNGVNFIRCNAADGKLYFTSWDCNLYCLDAYTGKEIWRFRADGSPSYLPPFDEAFEVVMKIPESEMEEGSRKMYDISVTEDEGNTNFYKSRITYNVSTEYAAKGKYQIDSDEEAL